MERVQRAKWGSRTGFLLAAIGSAVGLGNIWRFPYIAYKNGGGAFLIPYIVALILVGVPLLIAEQGLGHYFNASAPLSFYRIRRSLEWIGWWPVLLIMFGIMLYYTVVMGWCINYLFYSIDLSWGNNVESFFLNDFLGISSNPFELGSIRWDILGSTFCVWAILAFVGIKGVNKGLERINKICVPLLLVLMLTMMVWILFLPGSTQGMISLLTPDTSRLTDLTVWTDAFSQVFFSLSLAFGIMIAYASYLGKNPQIVENSWITAIADSGFAIFAGLVVFGTLGVMASTQGVNMSDVVKGGPGLAFIIYPQAISLLPFGSSFFGILFFSALLFAGITSAVSIVEAFVSAVTDNFKLSRNSVVLVLCGLGFLGSTIFTMSSGLYWLDIVDHFLNNFGLLAIGLLEAIAIAWFLGTKRICNHVNMGGTFHIGRYWSICLRFIIPIVLIAMLVLAVIKDVSTPYEGYSWTALIGIGIVWFGLIVIAAIAMSVIAQKRRHDHHIRVSNVHSE